MNRTATPRPRSGFTLVEVMIAAALAAFVLVAILTTFLFLARSGVNLQNYSDMEAQGRRSLETFAEDVRQASAISWSSSTSVTLTVNSTAITYAYNSSAGTFTRAASGTTTTLITGIVSGTFSFTAYNVAGTQLPLATTADLTAAGTSTKQLQISLEASRTNNTVAQATNVVLSARFILRNKIVTA
ncbi:MAG TPA: prepilin-type N-terminal cleavage/methylation domain-containing protein [Opitutaceae bacterium]|nr:prepilin-type N-terminal cleavage/methylation domain-containing protein [Opitutaceae bacterium]